MAAWVIETEPLESEYLEAANTVTTLNGPIVDVEQIFTDLDLGQGTFRALTEDERQKLKRKIRRCLRAFFLSIRSQDLPTSLYATFANKVAADDALVTFNYDVALENELIHAQRFRVRNGYGRSFEADWDEPSSDVTVLRSFTGVSIGLARCLGEPRVGTSVRSPAVSGRDHSSTTWIQPSMIIQSVSLTRPSRVEG